MKYHFKNKVVWLTGASKGIGFSLAKKLYKEGANLILSARDTSTLIDFPEALLINCDVSIRQQILSAVDQIIEHYGKLDCIILNAGNAEYVDVTHFESAIYERMESVNFMSQVYAVEACLPHLRNSQQPLIVAMSSSVAWQGLSRGHAYSASKAASLNFFQGLALDLVKESIPVCVICPGFVKTPLTDKNDFPMPGLISSDNAAERIFKGISKLKIEIHFPKRFTWFLRLISMLPSGLRFKILSRIV